MLNESEDIVRELERRRKRRERLRRRQEEVGGRAQRERGSRVGAGCRCWVSVLAGAAPAAERRGGGCRLAAAEPCSRSRPR